MDSGTKLRMKADFSSETNVGENEAVSIKY